MKSQSIKLELEFSPNDLKQAIVTQAVAQIVEGCEYGDPSIHEMVTDKIDELLTDKIETYLNEWLHTPLQKTDSYGNERGEPETPIAHLIAGIEATWSECVNYRGERPSYNDAKLKRYEFVARQIVLDETEKLRKELRAMLQSTMVEKFKEELAATVAGLLTR